VTDNPADGSAEARLRDLQVITDAELSRLDDRDLLAVLLERARDILQADTAAVLLLDAEAGQLIATAAAGLEDEVRQGVRIPVGRGFAGRIAAERRPVILDRVDHTTVLNPVLLDRGIRSLLGVPMTAGGQVIGVLHVGSLSSRTFTGHDAELLQLAADRAAAAVQSMTTRADRVAAAALQHSLLPSALPAVPGAEFAARFIPGQDGVGGDWYDVFTLPSGELGLVIGDVGGSGLAAAVVMGRMRSALRAYALETSNPAEVLSRLDRKMQHFEPGATATVMYAVIQPGLARARVSCAGHIPPVTATPGNPSRVADIPVDVMIGITPGRTGRRMTMLDIPPGALFCMFTNGLVERPGRARDDGLARLCAALTAQPAEAAAAAAMAAMAGSAPAPDDIALLILRRQPLPPGIAGLRQSGQTRAAG
jgi:sigma-B regulation protein RsbU (phosphoserine phosphatase)